MAEHDIEKIVEAGGEVFNFRDPTKQPVADRVTSWSSTPSDTKYPSEKLVKDSLDGKANSADAELSTTSTNPLQNKEITRWHNIIIGDDGFVSGSAANPQLSLQKLKLGALSHYNKGVNIKIYTYDEGDEENASLVFDIANASDSVKDNFYNGLSMDTLFQSEAGKYVKIVYTGSSTCYFRALGVFMDTKDTSSTVSLFYGHLRISNVDYPESGQFSTWGSLVVAAFSKTAATVAELILRPKTSASKCRIYGFRCLNTYTGSDWAVLIGRATSALRLTNSRKLCVDLSRTADSTFDGSADQTNIPVKNTLPVARGGTGRTSVTAGNYVVGAGTSAMVEKTPKEVGSNVLSSLDDKSNASSYADFVDGDFVVGSDHVDASTISASTFVRRTALNLWNYINSKLSGSDVDIGGNAATATNATTADTAKAFDGSFTGTNSIASALGLKQNLVAWDLGANTYNASTNRAATVDSVVKRIAVKPDGFSASVDYTNAVELSIPYSADPGRVALMCVATTGNGDTASFQATFVKNANEKLKFVVGTIMASTGTFVSPVLKFLSSDDSSHAQKVVLYIDANVRCNLSCLVAANDGMSSITVTEVARSTADNYSSLQSWGRLANDSGVVHIDGTETIIGAKEFSRPGQDTNFTDSSGAESIVRARTSSNSNNGSCQLNAYAGGGKFGLYARNASGTGKWVACLDNDGVVNLGSSGDAVRIGGTKFVFGASQFGTDSNTFYWV